MVDIHITNVDPVFWKRLNNHLNALSPDGVQKRGDKKKYILKAVKQWLDDTELKDMIKNQCVLDQNGCKYQEGDE